MNDKRIVLGKENSDERLCKRFLIQLGYAERDIEEKPFGDRFPDFRIASEDTGVEARRLNKYETILGELINEENISIPIRETIQKTIGNISNDGMDRSWYIDINFIGYEALERIGSKKKLRLRNPIKWRLINILRSFSLNQHDLVQARSITDENGVDVLKIEFTAASSLENCSFILNLVSFDVDSGWTGEDFDSAVEVALREKNRRLTDSGDCCANHWLVLIDYVNHANSAANLAEFIQIALENTQWSRIILVNPLDLSKYRDLM